MTDSYGNHLADLDNLAEHQAETDQTIADQEKQDAFYNAHKEEKAEVDAKFAAEQEDPRNREQWGMGGVVKELQSAFMGGIQDTGSSIVTAPERVLDMLNGEMEKENAEGGYNTEWDDWFTNDANPIETKTWWGGLIRSATHFGTLAAAIIPAAGYA